MAVSKLRIIQVTVSLGILVLLCLVVDARGLARAVGSARLLPLVLSVGAYLLAAGFRAVRWMVIVNKDQREVGLADSFVPRNRGSVYPNKKPRNPSGSRGRWFRPYPRSVSAAAGPEGPASPGCRVDESSLLCSYYRLNRRGVKLIPPAFDRP